MKPLKRLKTRVSLATTKSLHAALGRVTMYDDIYLSSLPKGAAAYAGYVNGKWSTWDALVAAKANSALLLSIDVFGTANLAHCLDVENGDATNAQIADWFKRQKAAGVPVPVIYTSAENVQNVINICMEDLHLARTEFLVWSAHYTYSAHICAQAVCGYAAADGTQWSDEGPGGCDVSSLASYFLPWTLGTAPAPTPPAPTPPAPPGPKPLPAPEALTAVSATTTVAWHPVAGASGYTVAVFQLNGVKVSETSVAGTSYTITGLVPGWQYNVEVWADGGPVAPPHATLGITA
jgi:hypothetical protein